MLFAGGFGVLLAGGDGLVLAGAGCAAGGGVVFVDGVLGSAAAEGVVVDVFVLLAAFFFFLAGALRSALSAGSVPPASTPATAAGEATLMLCTFTPAPAVSVLEPPDLATPKAAANAAMMATRPMAIERGLHSWALLSRAPRAV